MRILGIRTAPAQLRYALIEVVDGNLSLSNSDSENLIKVPAGVVDSSDILAWQKEEIDRILRQNSGIQKVILKVGEYRRSDTKSNRLGAYLDAMVILASKQADIPVEEKIYKQLDTKRVQVKCDAETRVGKTKTHWNEQIADAIAAAWSARGDL